MTSVYGASPAENIVLAGTSLEICIPVHVTVIHLGCDIRPLVADLSPWRWGFDSGAVACTVRQTDEELSAILMFSNSLKMINTYINKYIFR